jgi:outer membrane protein
MFKKFGVSFAVLMSGHVLMAPLAMADTVLGGSLEAAYWASSAGGDATAGSASVDVENDLGFEDDKFAFFAASFEHPAPVLPNLRLEMTDLDQAADGTLATSFDGVTGAVKTTLDLTHMDLILYYEVLDNVVSLDLGIAAKKFDGKLEIKETGSATTSLTDIDETLPLVYLNADAELPLTGLSVGASVSGVSYSGNSLYDARARVRQGLGVAFLELGWRTLAATIDDLDDTDVDIDQSGAYLSVGLDF